MTSRTRGTSLALPSSTQIRQSSLFWQAWLDLLAFDLHRRGRNFPKLREFVNRQAIRSRASGPSLVREVTDAVNDACVWYPKQVLCLQRSAVTTCLLRKYGIGASMVIGAQILPFKAHAWTEVEGNPINERRDVHKVYSVLERC